VVPDCQGRKTKIMMNTAVVTSASERPLPSTSAAAPERVRGAVGEAKANPAANPAEVSAVVQARRELNVQILQSSAEVSLRAGDQSQALLFRGAIERINELLAPTLGPDAIQAKMSEDNSPEATAGRILSLSTGFFEAYAAQRPGADPDQVAKDFVDLIRGGFEKGFGEAKEILQGLKVFSGEIESGVMKTYELVSKGYDAFLASKLSPEKPAEAANTGDVAA
jgi:hypothetical protein